MDGYAVNWKGIDVSYEMMKCSEIKVGVLIVGKWRKVFTFALIEMQNMIMFKSVKRDHGD